MEIRSRIPEAQKYTDTDPQHCRYRRQPTNDPLSVRLWAAAPATTASALGAGLENVDAGARHGPNLVDFGSSATDDGAHRLVRHEHLEARLAIPIPARGVWKRRE
jgi:hypothetical protein